MRFSSAIAILVTLLGRPVLAEVTLVDEDRFVRLSIERVSTCSANEPIEQLVCDCQPGDPFGIDP
jgi:hypothetical protein